MRNSFTKNSLSGRPHMRGRPSGTQSDLSNNPVGLGNPQETFPAHDVGRGSSETIRAGTAMSKI